MIFKTLLTILLLLPCSASASVNPEKGNFFESMNDINRPLPNGPLNFSRYYNSSSSRIGWFGYGWSGPFETSLILSSDGTIGVHDNNSDSIIYYVPKKETNTTIYYTSQCGLTKIIPNNDGYTRVLPNKMSEVFDNQGRLVRRNYEEGKFISILYAGKNPTTLSNQFGQHIFITWDEIDRVSTLKNDENHTVSYTYNDRNELLGVDINTKYPTIYEYDKNHKLIRIIYEKNFDTKITYLPDTNGITRSEIDSDGSESFYEYHIDSNDSNHQWTTVTIKDPANASIAAGSNTYVRVHDYYYSTSDSGNKYLSHYMQRINGSVIANIFYNKQGLITQKLSNYGKIRKFTYNLTIDKITMVQEEDLSTKISYDQKGNMTQIKNNQGQNFLFTYDSNNQIVRMVDTDTKRKSHRDLRIQYNKKGKPTKISLIGVGTILVTYDDKGEILTVNSKKGSKMALKATQAFQDLSYIVSVTDTRK